MVYASVEQLRQDFQNIWQQFVGESYGDDRHLNEVMNYVLSHPGKLARPIFCLLSCEANGVGWQKAVRPALALEMIHSYSLVHDDLPCMDDDHLRRGRPTAHIRFDEAMAVLAGDALLTDAFAVVASEAFTPMLRDFPLSTEQNMRLTCEMAKAARSRGMVLGQALDILWTNAEDSPSKSHLERLHLLKTGALIGAACAAGGIAAGASAETVDGLRDFGAGIGLAFQIVDDVLDVTGGTGKSLGKDLAQNKFTYLNEFSAEEALSLAATVTSNAVENLKRLGLRTQGLVELSEQLLQRNH